MQHFLSLIFLPFSLPFSDYLSHKAATLYLFPITVSDAQGLSYYGDETLEKRLAMNSSDLVEARDAMIRQRLLAFRKPIYQVPALDQRRDPGQTTTEPQSLRLSSS